MNSTNIVIRAGWLEAHRGGVCDDALLEANIAVFRGEWGEEVALSRPVLARMAELGLRLDWLAPRVLSGKGLGRFHGLHSRASLVARGLPEPDVEGDRAARAAEQAAQRETHEGLSRAHKELCARCYDDCRPHFAAHEARGAAATTAEERRASLAILRADTAGLEAERDRAHRALIDERNARVKAARDAAHKAAYEDAVKAGLPALAEALADALGLP